MATIDFSLEPVANPASPPAGWTQPAWSDNARVGPRFYLSSGTETQWFFGTVQPTGAYAEITSFVVNGTSRGPILADASGNGYGLLCNSTNIRVFLYTAGSLVSLVHTSVGAAVANDKFRIQYNGSGDFSVLKNDVEISTFNDTTHTGPFYGGCFSRDGGAGVDIVSVDAAATLSITPSTSVPVDGALQTITCSGMTGPITAATIAGKDVLADLSGTDPSVPITFTVDVSALAASETNGDFPRIGKTSTISFTTATDGAVTSDVTLQPKAGWAVVDLAATLVKGVDDILTLIDAKHSITTAVGNQLYYSQDYSETITAQGVYSGGTLVPYQFTGYVIQQGGSATTVAASYGERFYPFGEGGGSVKKLTSSKLTGVKLTASKLTASKL